MENKSFKAFVVEEVDGSFKGSLKTKSIDELPEGDLVVKVTYSSLNYKDALSASGNKGVSKNYPHTPGIDAVGVVVESENPEFKIDDKVIVTSYDLGMNTAGGFGQYIRVPSKWAVKLPETLNMKESMIFGTAGFTAGMSVLRLAELVKPEDGDIIVSGSTGGVGSLSVAMLAKLGYSVKAITGKESAKEYLQSLGSKEIILRKDFEELASRPMLKPICAGAIDTVGGVILENIIKSTSLAGAVTCCGNVASPKINLTVFPFILRGVTLIGIDSQNCPMNYRKRVWDKLSTDWKLPQIMDNFEEIGFDELQDKIDIMLKGKSKGRIVLNLSK